MNRINFILLTLLFCPGFCALGSTKKFGFIVKPGKTMAVIGTPITLVAQLRAVNVKTVLWNVFDDSLAKIKGINILSSAPPGTGKAAFEHTVVITATRPGLVILDKLLVTVSSPAGDFDAMADPVRIKFTNEPAATSLNDIRQITDIPYRPLQISLFFLLISIAFIYIVTRFSINKINPKPTLNQTREKLLERIKLLEIEIESGAIVNEAIGDRVFEVLIEYLESAFLPGSAQVKSDYLFQTIAALDLKNQEKEEIISLLKTCGEIRFSHQNKTPHFLSAHLNKVKTIIINSPLSKTVNL